MQSDNITELAKALVKAQGEFSAIPKTSTNPFFKSKYADLATVVENATPIVTKNGLAVSQHLSHDGELDTLTTYLIHESGQYISSTMRLHLTKTDAQGQGSATTYARRYAYMAVLGLVADEDDDGNKASTKVDGTIKQAPEKPKSTVAEYKMTELRQAFLDAEITGDDVTDFCRKVIFKPVPTTTVEADKVLQALKTISEPF